MAEIHEKIVKKKKKKAMFEPFPNLV